MHPVDCALRLPPRRYREPVALDYDITSLAILLSILQPCPCQGVEFETVPVVAGDVGEALSVEAGFDSAGFAPSAAGALEASAGFAAPLPA